MKVVRLEIGPNSAILVGLTSEDAFNLQCGTALMTEPAHPGVCIVFVKDTQEELEAGFEDIRRKCEERFTRKE